MEYKIKSYSFWTHRKENNNIIKDFNTKCEYLYDLHQSLYKEYLTDYKRIDLIESYL